MIPRIGRQSKYWANPAGTHSQAMEVFTPYPTPQIAAVIDAESPPLAMATASRHLAVALAIATSGTIGEPKPVLAIILLDLVLAAIVSVPYQKWRLRGVGEALPATALLAIGVTAILAMTTGSGPLE
jgi:hypothetical protein